MSDLKLDEDWLGYDGISLSHPAIAEQQQENLRAARELDELFHRVFKQNPDGAKVLEHMMRQIAEQRMERTMTDQELRHIAGARELVYMIRDAVHRVETGYAVP